MPSLAEVVCRSVQSIRAEVCSNRALVRAGAPSPTSSDSAREMAATVVATLQRISQLTISSSRACQAATLEAASIGDSRSRLAELPSSPRSRRHPRELAGHAVLPFGDEIDENDRTRERLDAIECFIGGDSEHDVRLGARSVDAVLPLDAGPV